MNEEFISALEQIAEEKKISKESILEATESALAAAYRKDYAKPSQTIRCKIDPVKGSTQFWLEKKIVEEVADENSEILLDDAKKEVKSGAALDGEDAVLELEGFIRYTLPTKEDFGRIAAQTAKQVIIQKLKEVEREVVFDEYKNMEGQLFNGVVQQIEGGNIIVDLGRANGVMFPSEQITGENYRVGQRIKVLIIRVEQTNKGPQILVSRAADDIIKHLFMIEVPEIEAGTVAIMGIAREAGIRTKMSVRALQEGVDPVGSCVGQRGTRVQAVLSELGNEKIDIVLWNEDPAAYIMNALSPAKIDSVKLNPQAKEALIIVNADQLSLAIGKNGQNVRLAARLTDWKIDVVEVGSEAAERFKEPAKEEKPKKEKKSKETKEEIGKEIKEKKPKAVKEPKEKKEKAVKEPKEKKEPKAKKTKKKDESEPVGAISSTSADKHESPDETSNEATE